LTDDEREKFRKAMRKSDSRTKARIDSELLEFRPMYEGLPADEKSALKEWMREVLAVQEKQPRICMDLTLRVSLSERVGDDEYRTVRLPVKVILNAMETWDRGEHYAPASISELWSR
jgi:hypothetical protein